jgi:hypothetical protein
MPVLSVAPTVKFAVPATPLTHCPLAIEPLSEMTGGIGSSTVTSTVWVWSAAPGSQVLDPQITSWCRAVVPAGSGKAMGQPLLSKALVAQNCSCGRPITAVLLGTAMRLAPQWQLLRAIRPDQRTSVNVVPAGALKAWPELLKPRKVAPIRRLLMPPVSRLPVGQSAYALPAFPNGTHAPTPKLKSPAESHATTVYCRPIAVPGAASTVSAHPSSITSAKRAHRRCLVVTLFMLV